MRRYILALVFATTLVSALAPAHGQIQFNDERLKEAVKEELGITHDPSANDMLRLTRLNAYARGVNDLTGLEYAANLHTLSSFDKQISNISALADLTRLKWVWLHNSVNR